VIRLVFAGLLRFYKLFLSPLFPPSCRFAPSCSQYAHDAVLKHGPWRGVAFAAGRLLRCNPWNPGGFDPVP
jgi:putative membrane protein insertion efficiency factor